MAQNCDLAHSHLANVGVELADLTKAGGCGENCSHSTRWRFLLLRGSDLQPQRTPAFIAKRKYWVVKKSTVTTYSSGSSINCSGTCLVME